jgi:hypothetical protein
MKTIDQIRDSITAIQSEHSKRKDGTFRHVCAKCVCEKKPFEIKKPIQIGDNCSKNMVFVSRVNSIDQLLIVLNTNKSIFWNHRPFPTAVLKHQSLMVLINSVKMGSIWTIKKQTI